MHEEIEYIFVVAPGCRKRFDSFMIENEGIILEI
jgi:hypothetical protein